jgi:hypothetical protein
MIRSAFLFETGSQTGPIRLHFAIDQIASIELHPSNCIHQIASDKFEPPRRKARFAAEITPRRTGVQNQLLRVLFAAQYDHPDKQDRQYCTHCSYCGSVHGSLLS